jgi:hypothetical protein
VADAYNDLMRLRNATALSIIAVLALVGVGVNRPILAQRAPARPAAPAPGRAPAAPRAEAAVPFKVGETLSYDVSWTSFLVAASATVSVQEKKPSFNSTAYYIVAEGRPIPLLARLYSLYYKMDSLVDTYTVLSQRGSLYAEEGSARRTATTRFDRGARRVFFEEQSDIPVKLDYAAPADVQDGLATLYALRMRTPKPGEKRTITVADSGTLYNVQLTVGNPERVSVPFVTTNAWSFKGFIADSEGQPVWDNIAIWISTDARRLPVKMQADLPVGSFVLALKDAK